MSTSVELNGSIGDDDARVEFQEAWWDTPHFGRPVVQINDLVCRNDAAATRVIDRLLATCGAHDVALVSCRLPTARISESMLLERHGFRHIEVVLHPELRLDGRMVDAPRSPACESRLALPEDLPALAEIAQSAFVNERFFVDPRIPRGIAAARYAAWMKSALTHPSQRLETIVFEGALAGFFVSERRDRGICYWHLNAISPRLQGKGVGRLAWQRMADVAVAEGCAAVRSCIAVRNVRAMNLYAALGYRFADPAMTLHWIP